VGFHPKRAQNRDKNEPEIVVALQFVGATIMFGSEIDLIVGFNGVNYLMEVKADAEKEYNISKGKLNKKQQKAHDEWKGQICVVYSPAEALDVIGIRGPMRVMALAAALAERAKRKRRRR
jgi:hypothetical protein